MVGFKSPANSWYPKDHLGSARVAEMPIEIEGYYRRALDYSWLNEGLPNDLDRLAAIVGKGCTREHAALFIGMFEPHRKDASKLISERQEIERKKQKENHKKRKEAGRISGVKRREQSRLRAEQTFKQNANKIEHSDSDSDSDSDSETSSMIDTYADACVSAFPNEDRRLIEIAILETMINRMESPGQLKPIRSPAKYFEAEIRKWISQGKGLDTRTIDGLLEKRRGQVLKTK